FFQSISYEHDVETQVFASLLFKTHYAYTTPTFYIITTFRIRFFCSWSVGGQRIDFFAGDQRRDGTLQGFRKCENGIGWRHQFDYRKPSWFGILWPVRYFRHTQL